MYSEFIHVNLTNKQAYFNAYFSMLYNYHRTTSIENIDVLI